MNRSMLRDTQWARIEMLCAGKAKELCTGKAKERGVAGRDNRMFVEAVLWITHTGSPWRNLPKQFGRWHTAYIRAYRWSRKGIWAQMAEALKGDADLAQLFINSTIVRAHQGAADAQEKRGSKKHLDAAKAD